MGSCPMTALVGSGTGGASKFWMGLLMGAFLTWAHVAAMKKGLGSSSSGSGSSGNDGKMTKKKTTVIRKAGTKSWRMSKWIKSGGILRTQGLCGDFSKMPGSSIAQQTAEALAELDEILKEAGVTRKHLLAMTIYLDDYNTDFDAMNEVYDKWVDPAGLPTRLCVQAGLGDCKIEIRAEAYYDEQDEE